MPALLADLRAFYGDGPATIMLDDRGMEATLGPALVAAGCVPRAAQTYLVHVGPVPEVRPVPGVTLEPVTEATIVEWSVAKLKGFANSEEEPDPERLRTEVLLREAELPEIGRFLLARVGREAASIMAWYEGEDRLIFLLATRVPFRNHGIARRLLTDLLADTYARGCRSILISCDPADTPIQLYRRLGFTDEVYWRRAYEVPPGRGH